MSKISKYIYIVFTSLFIVSVLIFSCKKKDIITGVVAREIYVNNTGQSMEIIRYMREQSDKKFSIAKGDTLTIENSIDEGADSSGTIYTADSAKVIFADGKQYYVDDTTTMIPNFLHSKRTISANGKIHYYRYTFSEFDYESAK